MESREGRALTRPAFFVPARQGSAACIPNRKVPLTSKKCCSSLFEGSLQPQKEDPAMPYKDTKHLQETLKRELWSKVESGCRSGRKPSWTGVSLTKQRRCTQSSLEVLPRANDHKDLRRNTPRPPLVAPPLHRPKFGGETSIRQTSWVPWVSLAVQEKTIGI